MYTTSPKHNPNYLAKIHTITNLHPHPKADRLQLTVIDGNSVIIGLDTKIGDTGVFFPVECKINAEYLSKNNQFEDKLTNENKEVKGFFNKHGRVRAIKLREAKSEGYWTTLDTLQKWDPSVNISMVENGLYFDTVNGKLFVEKYIPRSNVAKDRPDRNQPKMKRESKLVEGQFRFHEDTSQLGRNMHRLMDNPKITITQKIHGSSFIAANLLCKRKLSWLEKLAMKFGCKIVTTEYDEVYSSRKVVKNQYDKPLESGYYSVDIWGQVNNELKEFIEPGISLYGEIVGYVDESGKMIQKGYDYGCAFGTHAVYIYRITSTSAAGHVYEFTWDQVQAYCEKYGLNTVPTYYQGTVKGWFVNVANQDCSWFNKDEVLNYLKKKYLEKTLPNGLPDEGICIRIEQGLTQETYKLKCHSFLMQESKLLDEGEVDMETEESQEEETV